MAKKFFKKLIPKTKVVLSNGTAIQFETIDGLVGYRVTDKESEINEYYAFMRQQRYGVSEISEDEYNKEFADKKKAFGLSKVPTWNREVLGETPSRPINPLQGLGQDAVRAAVGIEGNSDIRMEEMPFEHKPALPATASQASASLNLGKRT